MVFPLIPLIGALGSAAGAGGSIFSAILGGNAQDEANRQNWLINLWNMRQREKERREGMEYAEKIRGEGKLGATDAQGTRTYYKEGEGWVTELGKRPRELEEYFYTQELPELRDKFKRDVSRGREAEDVTGQLLAEFKRVVKEDPEAVEDLLYSISSREIGKNTNQVLGSMATHGLRTGSMGAYEAAGRGAQREGSEQRRRAAQDAKLQAMDYVEGKYSKQRGDLSQLYRLFAEQAGQKLDPSMLPGAGPAAATALMNQFAQAGQAGNTMGATAIGQQGGTLQGREPMMGQANMWGGIGNALAGAADRVGSSMERYNMNNMLQDYITRGGQLNLNQGGLADLMEQRVRAGGNAF